MQKHIKMIMVVSCFALLQVGCSIRFSGTDNDSFGVAGGGGSGPGGQGGPAGGGGSGGGTGVFVTPLTSTQGTVAVRSFREILPSLRVMLPVVPSSDVATDYFTEGSSTFSASGAANEVHSPMLLKSLELSSFVCEAFVEQECTKAVNECQVRAPRTNVFSDVNFEDGRQTFNSNTRLLVINKLAARLWRRDANAQEITILQEFLAEAEQGTSTANDGNGEEVVRDLLLGLCTVMAASSDTLSLM